MVALPGGGPKVLTVKSTLLGSDKMLPLRVDGREALSALSEYTIDAVANASILTGRVKLDLHALLGTKVLVTFDVLGAERHIHGYVTRAVRGERHGRFDRYNLVLRPWLWFATRSKNSRVFQNKTVRQIVDAVLAPYKSALQWDLQATLPKLEYCVQYDETDFDFVSRLLEEYGVYYFFKHSDSDHTLMLVDDMGGHAKRKSAGPIIWSGKLDGDNRLTGWHTLEEVRSAKAVVRDYDYLASATEIDASDNGAAAATSAVLGEAEIYEFPARVVLNQTVDATKGHGKAADAAAKRLIEAAQSMQRLHSGECNAHDMVCGATFKLSNAPRSDEDGEYLIVASEFRAEYGDHEAISDLKAIKQRRDGYLGNIQAIPVKRVFRPERLTPRPRMVGPQIATVVGADGDEIKTDKHGRIKIKFPWDRDEEKNENSSCWVRVAMPWAGEKMGLWMLPRVGHEVVVSFIGGDPDRPIVTGSVHNDANPPPHELPKYADVATWISHSTKGGAADANNELRFCDTKDKEHVWLQAQKAFYRHVKGDTFDHLEMNETRKVVRTVKEVIGMNWFMNVGDDVMHDIGRDQHTTVAGDLFTTGGATWQVKLAKDYSLKVGADLGMDVTGKTALKSGGDVNVQTNGALNLKATGNLVGEATGKVSLKSAADVLMQGMNIKAKGSAEIVLEATAGIKIVCGASVITLGPAGVTIDGPLVKVNCGGGGGSAGAAESAAAAEPKEAAEALVQDQLKPDKAEDYDKLLADPIAPPAAGAGGVPAVDTPDVPDLNVPVLPSLPSPFLSDAALGAAAAAAALAAMAGSAGASILEDALTEDEQPQAHSTAEVDRVLAASDGAEDIIRATEEAGKDLEAKTHEQVLGYAEAEEDATRKAEEAGKDRGALSKIQVLRRSGVNERVAKMNERAGRDLEAKTHDQVLENAASGVAQAQQAEEAGRDRDAQTQDQVQQASDTGEAGARQAEEAGKDADAQSQAQVQQASDTGEAQARQAEKDADGGGGAA